MRIQDDTVFLPHHLKAHFAACRAIPQLLQKSNKLILMRIALLFLLAIYKEKQSV